VLSDLGFYYHLHGQQQDEQSEQRRLYKEAEENYNRALGLKRNEATLFNLAFLLLTNSRFHEAFALLKSVPEICGKESILGLDDRDAPLLNRNLRKRLFSPHKNNKVVVKTVVLAYFSMVQCYKALEDYTNALSEAFKLERFVCELKNPASTDYVLVACAFEEMNKPTKAEFFFKKCSAEI
jgi:tetratricopeptide (TPR) repeat protein